MPANPTPPWTAEREVGPELARRLISERFPDLATARVEPLGQGWDNTVFLVDGAWVFRFPRRAIAVALIETECRLLPALAPRLPLAIPVPTRIRRSGAEFPWPFAGYRRIDGETACRAVLDEGQRGRAAGPLARFLAALHAFPIDEAARLGLEPDTIRRLDLAHRTERTRERLEEAHRLGLIDDAAAWDAVVADLPAGWTAGSSTVVHGDLYARHVLVDAAGAPCGVIDWGDVHRGDPAVDLSLAHGFLPRSAHDAFRAAYGEIDPATWRVARFRALHAAAAMLVYAHDVGDRALLRESLTALRYVAA